MYKKGESGNPAGRPIGSKNLATSHIRSAVEDFISRKIVEVDEIWETLSPNEKIKMLSSLLDFILPKMRSQAITLSDFESLSTEDLRRLASEVIDQSQRGGTDESE